MQPGALLTSLGSAISPTSRRCLASCGKPLAVLAVLATGAIVFTGAAALLGTSQPGAVFHAAAEGAAMEAGRALHALPLHQPSAQRATVLDDTLAGLKEGAFGITFAQPLIDAMAAGLDAAAAAGLLVPSVLVDADRPPLRVEIMGFESQPQRFLAPTRTPRP